MNRLMSLSLAGLAAAVIFAAASPARAAVDLQLVSCNLTQDVCGSGGPGHLNGSIEPGEYGYFTITVTNVGDQTATNINTVAVAVTPGVTMVVELGTLPDIRPGATVTSTVPFEFTVDASVPCGTSLLFSITVQALQQRITQPCSFNVPSPCTVCAPAADLVLEMCVVTDVCPTGGAGDRDDNVDPGEEPYARLVVRNDGGTTATNVVAVVTSGTPGVVIVTGSTTFPDIPPGASEVGNNPIDFTVDLSVPCGSDVVLSVEITSDSGSRTEVCVRTIPVACNPCTALPDLTVVRCGYQDDCPSGGPGDANGSIEPGETGVVDVPVQNRGGSAANNVVVTMTTATPGVTITIPTADYGTIDPGLTAGPAVAHAIAVDAAVPCGTTVVLDLLIEADEGTWTESCTYTIPGGCNPCTPEPVLLVTECTFFDACAAGGPGDANGAVEPGETAELRVLLENVGGSAANNVVVTASTATPGVTVTQPTGNYGAIPAGGMAVNAPPLFEIAVDAAVTCGTNIVIDLQIDAFEGTWTDACSTVIPVACEQCVVGPVLGVASCNAVDDCDVGGAGDGNGSVEPGETAAITLEVTNSGVGAANNVTATVTTATPGVTVDQGSTTFGTIPAGGTATGAVTIDISVDLTVACGTSIILDVELASDEGGRTDTCTIVVPAPCEACTVFPPNLELSGCAAVDSCAVGGPGDGDGAVDPGETADVTLSVTNTGTGEATNVTATVTTATPGVTITQGSSTFGTVAVGATVDGTLPIGIRLDTTVPCGTSIVLDVELQSDQGPTTTSCAVDVPDPCTRCDTGGAVEEVPYVLPTCNSDGSLQIEWMVAPGAVTYGIHQGTIAVFAGPSPPDYDHGCVASGLTPPLTVVPGTTCGDGTDIYLLVVGLGAADEEGPYGFANHQRTGTTARPVGTPTCP